MDKALLPHFGWRDDFQTLQYERCVLHPYATRLGANEYTDCFGFTVYAIIQTVGLFSSLYIADRFSKKILLPVGLIGVGLCGAYLATLHRLPVISSPLVLWHFLGKWFTGLYC